MTGRRKAGDEESTVILVRSLEDSLVHRRTIESCRWCAIAILTEHQ